MIDGMAEARVSFHIGARARARARARDGVRARAMARARASARLNNILQRCVAVLVVVALARQTNEHGF